MRHLTFLLFLLPHILSAQINFQQGTWRKVLDEAKSSGKLVFVDFYASWCGPCKKMDREVFTDPEVGAFMNAFFVSHKVNTEFGAGKTMAQEHGINMLPTFLFFRPDGSPAYRFFGGSVKEAFLMQVRDALATTDYGQTYLLYEKTWDEGHRTTEMAKYYLKIRQHYGLPVAPLLDDYLSELPSDSMHLPSTAKVVAEHTQTPEGKGYEYLLAHRKERRCSRALEALAEAQLRAAIATGKEAEFQQVIKMWDEIAESAPMAELKKSRCHLRYHIETGRTADFDQYTRRWVPTHLLPLLADTTQPDSLLRQEAQLIFEDVVWQYAEYVKDESGHRAVLEWATQAAALGHLSPACCGYAAHIAGLLRQPEAVKEWLKQAKQTAQQRGENIGVWDKRLAECCK